MKLETLKAERERLAAYGMACALELVDAEIERMSHKDDAPASRKDDAVSKDDAPASRQAPARQNTAAPTEPGKRPLKSANNG